MHWALRRAGWLGLAVGLCWGCGGGGDGGGSAPVAGDGAQVSSPSSAGAGNGAVAGSGGAGASGAMTGASGAGAAGTAGGDSGMAGTMAGASGMGGSGTAGMGAGGVAGVPGMAGAGGAGSGGTGASSGPSFSFFVTSLEAMRRLSGSQDGFGGDLGGLEGADGICQEIAAGVGAGDKTWRAFLSVTKGPDGGPVHAIDRIGPGPWYDRNLRLVAMNIEGLLKERPDGDPQTVDDLPDENGVPLSTLGDTHDVLTGSDKNGRLASTDPADTCQDWTSAQAEGSGDRIMCGHSWPRCADPMFGNGQFCNAGMGGMGGGGWPFPGGGGPGGAFGNGSHWISDHTVHGCAPGVNLVQNGPGDVSKRTVGEGGGWGAIYCFALAQ